MSESPAETNRLNYSDDLFLRAHRALGISAINQVLWHFPEPLERNAIEQFHRRLNQGRLAREVRYSTVPGARDCWVPSRSEAPLVFWPQPLEPERIGSWAVQDMQVELNPVGGPAWRLSYAEVADATSVLSLVSSHVLADGGALLAAVQEAVAGDPVPRLPIEVAPDWRPRLSQELGDAAHQVRESASGVYGAWKRRKSAPPKPAGLTSADTPMPAPRPDDDHPHTPVTLAVDLPSAHLKAAAERAGGTINSLFIALAAELLAASGRVPSPSQIRVAVPMSQRQGPPDRRSNASSGVSLTVDIDADGRVPDLQAIRSASRKEFAEHAAGTRDDPLEHYRPLLQLVPDALLKLGAKNSPAPLLLASNLGRLPELFTHPFGLTPMTLSMRTSAFGPGTTKGGTRRTRGGMATWLAEHGQTSTWTVTGLDPDHFGDRARLVAQVQELCRRWDVQPMRIT